MNIYVEKLLQVNLRMSQMSAQANTAGSQALLSVMCTNLMRGDGAMFESGVTGGSPSLSRTTTNTIKVTAVVLTISMS